jgi:hypothetical protein
MAQLQGVEPIDISAESRAVGLIGLLQVGAGTEE